MLPSDTPLHLTIIYSPSDLAEAARVAGMSARLRRQMPNIISANVTAGRVKTEDVGYFFPADRAGAIQVAESLGQLTDRTEPVVLVHARALPRPGTVEIRLPLKQEKDLNNEIN